MQTIRTRTCSNPGGGVVVYPIDTQGPKEKGKEAEPPKTPVAASRAAARAADAAKRKTATAG